MPSGGIKDGQNVAKIRRAAKNAGSLAPLPLNPGDKAGSGNPRIMWEPVGARKPGQGQIGRCGSLWI